MYRLKDNKIARAALPVLITAVLYSVILFARHIFPFGKDTIDYYDMAQQIAAFYYHVYDMLHGTKAFFYDFYTALGTNMVMSTSGCSNISIFNLFFLFIRRENLLKSLSVFHMIKIMVMTYTMYFYVHKSYKLRYYFEVIISVSYSFCGFVLMLYITNQWMDIAALFPLLMYFYDKLLKEGKITGYVIVLSLITVNSYYLSFMIMLFLILYTGLIISCEKIYVPFEKRKRIYIMELFAGTVFALLLSSFIIVPQLTQTLTSARFGNSGEGGLITRYRDILKQVRPAYTTRWFALFNSSILFAIILTGMIRLKNTKKSIFMTVSLILIMCLELFIESINLIWHFGSYVQYPIRNGFIIYFVLAILACSYAQRLFKEGFERISLAGIVVSLIVFVIFSYVFNLHKGMSVRSVFHAVAVMMAVSFFLYLFMFLWKGGRHYSFSLVILISEILCFGFIMYGKPGFVTGYGEEPEQEGEYIRICEQLNKEFDLSGEVIYRIKNPDESLNANYGLVLRRAALSNWTHLVPKETQDEAARWGYSVQFTRLLDAGGTAFTDALIGIRDVVSCKELDEKLYEKTDSCTVVTDHLTGESTEYHLYRCRYLLPFAMPAYSNAFIDSEMETRDMVNYQNQIYRALTGADTDEEQNITEWIVRNSQLVSDDGGLNIQDIKDGTGKNIKRVILNRKITGKKALYYTANCYDTEDGNIKIAVSDSDGDRIIEIPTIKDEDNLLYPAHFNNNSVYLGTFENEEVFVTIDMEISEDKEEKPVFISSLDLNKLRLLCDSYDQASMNEKLKVGKKSIEFSTYIDETSGSAVMLLPIVYDEGWECSINGKKSNIAYPYNGLFTAIPLYLGENEISLKYTPKGMGVGIILSIAGMIIWILYTVIKESKNEFIRDEFNLLSKDVEGWLTPLYLICFFVLLCIMYFIPVIYAAISVVL
ncbi:MAG: YfhO family protein [Lachnospiraceae bacterium]|nr:YfhO family protein [Lachnospiraceae bacterium]